MLPPGGASFKEQSWFRHDYTIMASAYLLAKNVASEENSSFLHLTLLIDINTYIMWCAEWETDFERVKEAKNDFVTDSDRKM